MATSANHPVNSDLLFCPRLIPASQQQALPDGFAVRPLSIKDYDKGFLQALSQLTTVGDLTKEQFVDRFSYLKAHNHEYFTIVIEDVKKSLIIAAGTVFVERKFVHNTGLVGHIEDIVTLQTYRGLNLGKRIIETLKDIGKGRGCYKVILDCSDKNIPFYEKCGFVHKEYEMVWYIDESKNTPAAAKPIVKSKL
ncbi:acyl-CoA N-acyltransferase [Polychytrium aggregatum]|uniref:acyl-CoA N-acyltransferase n=1 Tax=Polychytrium aggregatum TaxID=110093 RepID=UPI0022FEDEBE|nr:acyl-CoA N-acyltransferase [Polychytrium aggregatum]KAI9206188.1 acyl-CoA N-acyltransferase [Polychytrium aggregatum]